MRIFLSYAHDDDDYFRLFKQGLEKRVKRHDWEIWGDHKLLAGDVWHDVIQDRVADCDCAVLLLSTSFLASHYIENEELKKFFDRQKHDEMLIVPVEIRPCQFEYHSELSKRQVFRPPGKDFDKPRLNTVAFSDVLERNEFQQLTHCSWSDRFLDDFVVKLKAAADRRAATPTPAKPAPRPVEADFLPAVEIQNTGRSMRGMEAFMPQPAYLDGLAMGYADFKMSTAMLGPRSSEQELARTSQVSNVLTERLLDDIAAFREKVLDSDHLKKLYPKIHFDEIIYPDKLGHATLETITEKRQQRHRFPWHERGLIVSALTLRLMRNLDEKAAYHLLDFVRDREPQVWKKALTGLVMAYMHHEQRPDFVPPEHLRHDLAILREDPEVAEALLEITEHLARPETEHDQWDKHIGKVKFDEKFEFFQQVSHWFLPFYEGNPVLQERIADPELRDLLLRTREWRPDVLKYAFCLNYRQLSPVERQSTVEELRKNTYVDEGRYAYIRHLSSGLDKAEALRRSREVPDAIRQVRFFLRYFNSDKFREVALEKVPLYNSSLAQLLASEHWLTQLRAMWLYWEDKYEEAIPYFQQILVQEPKHPFFLSRLGRMYGANKRYDEAMEQLEKVLIGYPEEIWVLDWMARCYRGKEDYAQELLYRQRVAELEPEDAANLGMVGAALEGLNRYDEAIEQRKKAEAIDPNLVWNLRGLAWCYRQKEDYDQELPYRQRVAGFEPEDAANWGMVGSVLGLLKRYDEAIEQRKKAEALDPNLAWNLRGLAVCYRQKEDYEEELPYRQRVAELEPEGAGNWCDLAQCQFKLQLREDALGSLERAIAVAGDAADTQHSIGWAYFVGGCIPEAKPHFLYSLELAEMEPNAHMNLGHISLIEQNEPEAFAYYQRSFELSEDVPKLLEGYEDDYQYLAPHGIQREHYWRVVRQAQAAAGV